jgi:hypothetical protein
MPYPGQHHRSRCGALSGRTAEGGCSHVAVGYCRIPEKHDLILGIGPRHSL